ncbi:hypothetical protein CSKR_112036 [Clonorchis sinensis]|uniref:Uncharacterized protein n=1 Tax=Clonorchis sinensis TaxID=79923 RepID=A0A3R7FQB6_CLOSI|nr:hypothetical protein CSKR_112036 [Clonorchis sinensis]
MLVQCILKDGVLVTVCPSCNIYYSVQLCEQTNMRFDYFQFRTALEENIMLTETQGLRLPDEPQEGRTRSWDQLEHEAAWCSTFSCLKTSQTGDSAGFQQLEHEAAWCSTFSCLKTSQTRDSAGFQVSLSQNQIDFQMSVFLVNRLVVLTERLRATNANL